jgi:tRNA-specific 2-thiouridylase
MEVKKQLDTTSDNTGRNDRVLIGLNGSLNSMVAAYLLKIQKFEMTAVTVIPVWDGFSGDLNNAISCQINQTKLQLIKDFCQQLGISLHLIKTDEEFVETIVEKWMSSKLTATLNTSCSSCHDLRMKILFEKALSLGIDKVATGHCAKIFHNEIHDKFYVNSSNDESADQSHLLARLPQPMLRRLLLPLADLVQKEVHKLAENFGFIQEADQKNLSCFQDHDSKSFLLKKIPKKMNISGEVYNFFSERLGDHLGILNYDYGEKVDLSNLPPNQENYYLNYSRAENKIIIGPMNMLEHKDFLLTNCHVTEETSWNGPLKVFLRINSSTWVEAITYPKNFSSAWMELMQSTIIKQGDLVYAYRKKGKNSKLLFSGYVKTNIKTSNASEESLDEIKTHHHIFDL